MTPNNFRRNIFLTAAIAALAAPAFTGGVAPQPSLPEGELEKAILAATIDQNTGRSTLFYKDDIDTLAAIAVNVETILQEQAEDTARQQQNSRYRTIGFHFVCSGLTVAFTLAALICHESTS